MKSTRIRAFAQIAVALLIAACARVAQTTAPVAAPTPATCAHCNALSMAPEVTRAIEQRITDLVSRGPECSAYGEVLERSYRDQRIVIRPFMWRVGPHLVSGEATRDGAMVLAKDIDSLNVGVRTVDDLLRSMEHEAVHIAFNISSGDETNEARVDTFVRTCGSAGTDTDATSRRSGN